MSALPAVHKPIEIQRRLVELGRIRMGEKGPRGEPRQRSTFRLTSASKRLLEAAAALYGGQVREWKDAPDEGYYELATEARELDILIPPTLASYSQAYELWDRGGLLRRCDGKTESVSGEACRCDREGERLCQPTTRVSVMLHKVPGLGVWRLESKGWDAAATLPATLETLGAMAPGLWIPAVLRIERRSVRRRVEGRPQTRRFIVARIDILGGTVEQALQGGLAVTPLRRLDSGDRMEKVARPALPVGPDLPAQTGWSREAQAPHGTRPFNQASTGTEPSGAGQEADGDVSLASSKAADPGRRGSGRGRAASSSTDEGAVVVTSPPAAAPSPAEWTKDEVEDVIERATLPWPEERR